MFSSAQNKDKEIFERIAKILSDYQLLAVQDADKLRLQIPSQEIWRFFIDGVQQAHGRGLCVLLPKLPGMPEEIVKDPHLLSSQPIAQSKIIDFVKKQDGVKKAEHFYKSKTWMMLKNFKYELTQAGCEQLSFLDLINLDKCWLPFEYNEPGYLESLVQAFDMIFNLDAITTDFIINLHAEATQYVDSIDSQRKFRSKCYAGFGITKTASLGKIVRLGNCSIEGIFETLERNHPDIFFDIFIPESTAHIRINQSTVAQIKTYFATHPNEKIEISSELIQKICSPHSPFVIKNIDAINFIIQKLLVTKNNKELAINLYELIDKYQIYVESRQQLGLTHKMLKENIKQLISEYESSVAKALTPKDKLLAIILFIQQLEQLHPFIDGNTRTFSMLLLNHLLIRHGFPLVILENPNQFGLLSQTELLNAVLTGMENCLKLVKEGILFDISTSETLDYLKSDAKYAPMLEYFERTVEIENMRREEKSSRLLLS